MVLMLLKVTWVLDGHVSGVCICGSQNLQGDNVITLHCCVFVKTGTPALRRSAFWE